MLPDEGNTIKFRSHPRLDHKDSKRKLNKKLSYRRDSARRRSLRHSRSFKVTDFDDNQKPICDFIL